MYNIPSVPKEVNNEDINKILKRIKRLVDNYNENINNYNKNKDECFKLINKVTNMIKEGEINKNIKNEAIKLFNKLSKLLNSIEGQLKEYIKIYKGIKDANSELQSKAKKGLTANDLPLVEASLLSSLRLIDSIEIMEKEVNSIKESQAAIERFIKAIPVQ